MDNKDINNQSDSNNPLNWKTLGFFSAEEYLVYIFKKTEKITAALYLVSGLLKDDEPMKWELRDRGMDLLTSSFTASSTLPGDKNMVIQTLFTAALETMSLLNVARISNLISEMNHSLLIKEIDNVIVMLKERLAQNAENAGYILSESFFRTQDLPSFNTKPQDGFKRQNISAENLPKNQLIKRSNQGQSNTDEKKSKRQEDILFVLKGQSNLTIKDFSKTIKDCSEKTIQRELLDLVEKGIVKKIGQRRWSRYSLK